MRIFQDKGLDADEVDYSRWETVNGDSMGMRDMRTEYLERCIETLEYYAQRYPAHENREIWERYLDEMEDELALRGTEQ